MSGMLSSASVVLSQNTPLRGCGYMQRHLSGQQRGKTGLWSPLCHLLPGSWLWNSFWYRPGKKRRNKEKLKQRWKGRARVHLQYDVTVWYREECLNPSGKSSGRLLNPHGWSCYRQSVAFCPLVPSLLIRVRHPVEKGNPLTVRAAVFVLPNSIPFHSLSAHSVYFGALLHRGAWLSRRTKTSRWLPMWWHDRWKQLPLKER